MLRIARADFDQVAVLARDVMQFEHLGQFHERLSDAVVRLGIGLVASHRHERKQTEPERPRVHLGAVPLDHSSSFQLADALEHGGWREPDGAGDVHLGFAGIGLKPLEYLKVCRIEGFVEGHQAIIADTGLEFRPIFCWTCILTNNLR